MRETKKSCKKLRDVGFHPCPKGNRAITLIALIITIIIMLILVAVTISILVKSNIIGIAENAADKTKTAYEKESSLGSKITIGGVEYDGISGYIQSKCSHNWGDWNVVKEPSYTEAGERNRECTKCGLEQTEYPSMLACDKHTYDENDWVVETSATCKEKGLKYVICTTCSTRIEEEIEIDTENGHNFVGMNCTICGQKKVLPTVVAGERATETSQYSDGTKTAIIPKGFTVSAIKNDTTDETTIDGGLVIYDIPAEDLADSTKVDWTNPDTVKPNYNQFVWIPVVVNKTTAPVDTETSIASFRRSYWEDSSDGGTRSEDIPNDGTDDYTEPYAFDDSDYDGTNGTGIAVQIAELTESIYNYEGFYIGRYEAGVTGTTARIEGSSQTDPFVVQQDKYPYNYVMWGTSMNTVNAGGAVHLSNNLYSSTNTYYGATSMLCTGACWDAMLDFAKDSVHNVMECFDWGNFNTASFNITRGKYALFDNISFNLLSFQSITGESYKKQSYSESSYESYVLLTTGATDRNSSKNIYDVAGNCDEWTTEGYGSDCRVLRGGDCRDHGYLDMYGLGGTAGTRNRSSVGNAIKGDGSFRPILFVR